MDKWRTKTGVNITKRDLILTLTLRGTNSSKEGREEEELVEMEEQEEVRVQSMTIHNPNLSKLLKRRQALKGNTSNINAINKGGRRDK